MTFYGPKEMAASFRTVRKHTIQIAEDIPADQYHFRVTPDVQTVAEELAHIVTSPLWQIEVHAIDKKTFITFEDFSRYVARSGELARTLTGKSQIVEALRTRGEEFAHFLESLTPEQLGERVGFPPPVEPSTKTRFEMLLGAKEHEMHHRAKLMVVQRLLGIVPHLTRARQQMHAAASAAPTKG
jgi:uncharacterized damage-inducible protein DinB